MQELTKEITLDKALMKIREEVGYKEWHHKPEEKKKGSKPRKAGRPKSYSFQYIPMAVPNLKLLEKWNVPIEQHLAFMKLFRAKWFDAAPHLL